MCITAEITCTHGTLGNQMDTLLSYVNTKSMFQAFAWTQ